MTTQADAVEALTAQIRADLAGVSERLDAELQALTLQWPTLGRARRIRALIAFQRRVSTLTSAAQDIALTVPAAVGQAYQLGAAGMAIAARRTPIFGGADTAAIAALAADTYDDVLTATQGVRQATKETIRRLAREHVGDKLITGETPATASRKLERELGRHLTAVTYADGSKHALGSYTDMLIRTKTAEAHQVGGFAQARQVGIEYVEILDGPGCGWSSHQDARKANGLILTIEEAARYPLSHPRCRRVSSPRPDITSPGDLAGASPIGPQFSAEDIAREAANGGTGTSKAVTSKALARNLARTQRTISGTLTTERGLSAAQRRAQVRVTRRLS